MEGTLRVTPAELQNTAASFEMRGKTVASIMEDMLSLIRSMNSIWEGEASESYIAKFNALETDMNRVNIKIAEHVSDLNEIAANYIQAENTATGEHDALPQNPLE